MALEVSDFMDLYEGERYAERKTRGEDCPGYCIDGDNLERCNAFCDCAFVREIIQLGKNDLARLCVAEPLEIYLEQMLCESMGKNGNVFAYPCGTAFKTQDIYRIIRQATVAVLGKPMKVAHFNEYIKKGHDYFS